MVSRAIATCAGDPGTWTRMIRGLRGDDATHDPFMRDRASLIHGAKRCVLIATRTMRILLVEDEPDAARLLAKGLREQSYAVDVAADGRTALFRAETTNYDAIVLDLMLPALDGLTVCRSLRQAGSSVPILMLTARGTVQARVEGLDSGADDSLTKPFDFIELLARLRALIRRGVRP